MYADSIIKGTIYTADECGSFAQAMAVAEGTLLCVGTEAEAMAFAGPNTKIMQKAGLIIPGITEGHAHITCTSEMLFGVALGHETEPEAYLSKIRAYLESHPDAPVIIGSGYDNGVFGEGGPTAAMLDAVCADRPVVMIASDHHSRWVNSWVLERILNSCTISPLADAGMVKDAAGSPTGWLKESAAMALVRSIVPPMTPEQYAHAIAHYQQIAFENGVTIAFEPIFDSSHDYITRALGYKVLEEQGKLLLTVRLGYTLDPVEGMENEYRDLLTARDSLRDCKKVQLTNAKFFVDGVVECHTAYLRAPYADAPGDCGKPMTSQELMDAYVLRAMGDGLDVHTHVIGDAASDIAISAYEKAQQILGPGDYRNALTHVQLLWEDQMQRMEASHILAVVNPYWHIFNPVYYEELERPYLGEDRASREYPLGSIVRRGIPTSQASDFPVTVPPRSLDSLHIMVNRTEPGNTAFPPLNPGEAVSVREALDILTRGGAYQLRLEDRKGSLEPGKDADFVVLSHNVFTMDPQELYKAQVTETWIGGSPVWTI